MTKAMVFFAPPSGKWAHPARPPTAGFAQPAGSGGAEQCSAKPRLRPLAGRRLASALRSAIGWRVDRGFSR